MCRVGEESGKLGESITQMAEYYEKEYKDSQAVTTALIYPLILVVMMIAVLILAIVYVIPNYADIFTMEGIALPLPTQIMLSMGDFVSEYIVFVIVAIFGIIIAVIAFFHTPRGKSISGSIKLRMPIWRLGMSLCFCRCMSMLLASGMPIAEALMITYDAIGNVYLKSTFNNMCAGLKQGRKLSAVATEAKIFDIMLINMVEVGEETGSLVKPISQCAEYYQSERERASELITKLAEPIIMLFLGGVLALIMLSVILPTFELINAF
jgi:type IV pilus assembly protein PilC